MPWNAAYETTTGNLRKEQADTQANLAYQRAGVEQEYGFNDTSDPYARANLLQRSYQQGQLGTTNSMAARGQLYSGATQRARETNTFNMGQNLNALRGEYQQKMYGLDQDRLQSDQTYRRGLEDAEARRLESALEERPDPAEASPPLAQQVQQRRDQRKRGNQRGNRRQQRRRRRR